MLIEVIKRRRVLLFAVALLSVVVLIAVILAMVVFLCSDTHSILIYNKTGKNISHLVVLWPDGTCIPRNNLMRNEKVTVAHNVGADGVLQAFLLFERERQWYHIESLGKYISTGISSTHETVEISIDESGCPCCLNVSLSSECPQSGK